MKVQNMRSPKGNKVANQFVITNGNTETFQSYNSVIATKDYDKGETVLDSYYWDYSRTTSKYLNQFLGETKADTRRKIDSGEYRLANLN